MSFDSEIEEFIALWRSDAPNIEAHTSGSTGTPKRIMLPRRLVKESAWRSIRHFGLTRESVVHLMLSPSYIAGKMAIVRALEAECHLTREVPSSTPLSGPDTPRHITLLSAVGAQVAGMESLRQAGELPRIRHLLLGGAPLNPAMRVTATGLAEFVWESYGMTETASHIALRRVLASDPEGETPFTPLEDIRIGTDTRGCLQIEIPGFERLITNDLARILPDGTFTLLGRADNVIITGGVKVMPEEIERILSPLFQGRSFYVTSRPHSKWGEELLIAVEDKSVAHPVWLSPDTYFPDALPMSRHLERIPEHYKRPKAILLLPALERTSNGKIKRLKFNINRLPK